MPRAVLFDLDGTLLDIDLDTFLPAYLQAVACRVEAYLPPERFVRELMRSTGAMVADRDPSRTNQMVFREDFFPRLGLAEEELRPIFEDFYRRDFPRLHAYARPVPAARTVVQAIQRAGFRTAVATNPVFPLVAVRERLRWAGLADLPFDLITSYEIMHFCKPHPEYYAEVACLLGCRPEECMMAGDDPAMDLAGARAAGMRVFHVTNSAGGTGERGKLEDLLAVLRVPGGVPGAPVESRGNP
ncbi:MAG: HAD family hydrolase [bacterium]|nr:HAD family hydrolase [bacterium]